MSKALRAPKLLADQVMGYRTFVRLVFTGA